MSPDFVKRCQEELRDNDRKGDWEQWLPNAKELTQELSWHHAKLCQALLNGDTALIKGHAADVANICEKAYTMATRKEKAANRQAGLKIVSSSG